MWYSVVKTNTSLQKEWSNGYLIYPFIYNRSRCSGSAKCYNCNKLYLWGCWCCPDTCIVELSDSSVYGGLCPRCLHIHVGSSTLWLTGWSPYLPRVSCTRDHSESISKKGGGKGGWIKINVLIYYKRKLNFTS